MKQREWFLVGHSFAAPFVSDTGTAFVEADTAAMALELFARAYAHPCGLYSADAYTSATAYHKDRPPTARWLSAHAEEMGRLLDAGGCVSSEGPGVFRVNGKRHEIPHPKAGRVVPT